jgi:hypothetical protein
MHVTSCGYADAKIRNLTRKGFKLVVRLDFGIKIRRQAEIWPTGAKIGQRRPSGMISSYYSAIVTKKRKSPVFMRLSTTMPQESATRPSPAFLSSHCVLMPFCRLRPAERKKSPKTRRRRRT